MKCTKGVKQCLNMKFCKPSQGTAVAVHPTGTRITSPFDLQCHTGAMEVKVKQKRLLNALRVNISYLSTVSRPWYISWCKYILKIDF